MTLAGLCLFSCWKMGSFVLCLAFKTSKEFRLQAYGPPSVTTSLCTQINLLLLVKLHVLIWLHAGELSTRKHQDAETSIPFFIGWSYLTQYNWGPVISQKSNLFFLYHSNHFRFPPPIHVHKILLQKHSGSIKSVSVPVYTWSITCNTLNTTHI